MKGEHRFFGRNPDDRLEEVVLDTAVTDLGGEGRFADAANALDADDKRPAVRLEGLQNGANLFFPPDKIRTARQACQNIGFFGLLRICADAFDLLAISGD